MRDMLERLQTISGEQEDHEPEFNGPEHDVDNMTFSQQAVVFENSSAIDNILKEAHSIRKEISALLLEVEHLSTHNERFGTSVRRFSLIKKDSDSIARGIQQSGEALFNRLQALGNKSSQLEEKEGPGSAVSRIARVQYDTLTRDFHVVMSGYNKAEEMQRSICRERIQRQTSIMGTDITDEQLDVLVNKGGAGLAELSQSLQTQGGRTSHWALSEIKGRHKELVELEARLKDIHELFLNMAMLVEEQGSIINNIEKNVYSTQEYVEKVNVHIKKATQYKRKNPFLQLCPCLPCWRNNQTF
ncbi:hypothetical protein JOB18_011077 [Solea senegalensis]|uniref:Syntaxin-11-like n=1 Tax=Solea senegalensis TaxID=28829 RepID=A0AAV6RSG8_SOLSE|nr:syntaxin-11-like [Solea senegalensis]XP_043905343.1 syntaxin-11-like [Solea senegalensis]XP_043905344.1 syntaxin-11-like [Solea senegalensis]XP_043905345.1 syntaxin-11-like [Solea senegalensis]KAG7508371.1 syntaxin-11-like [Solea senegalensis]KAG7508372.1 hypothetical protein JOB18_011077 [Solea senegalensis]KAG7508373.1 hypothetical protein JOB18_011077 [Solea senegalensis]KAG7508374.1 hypothetical protein JOB18_011077 [Solea senegalensis]